MPIGPLATAGIQTGQQVLGTIMGLALEKHNDNRQIQQQQRLQDQQIAGQKQMVDYNYGKQLQMWKDTNYSAQMAQLAKAGLNPGLIYGMSGGGATTTGQATGNVTGGQAPSGGHEVIDMTQQAMGLQMMRAQIENINADTKNKQAETPNIPLTGKNIQANTANLLQGVENAKAQQVLTKVETDLKALDVEFAKGTLQNRMSQINLTLSGAIEQVKMLENERLISDATVQDKIKIIQGEAIGTMLKNALTEAEKDNTIQQTAESKQNVEKMIADITQRWVQLDQDQQRIEIQKFTEQIKANFPGLGATIGRVLNGAFEQMNHFITGKGLPGYQIPEHKKH